MLLLACSKNHLDIEHCKLNIEKEKDMAHSAFDHRHYMIIGSGDVPLINATKGRYA